MANSFYSAGVLMDEDKVIMRKRKEGPNAGKWELPMTEVDVSCESFRNAAARMISGEMKVPLDKVETLAVLSNEFEEYGGHLDLTFYAGIVSKNADLSHLDPEWEMVYIGGLTEADVVPENAQIFDALGTKMATAPDEITPIERN
ncbi:MAG: NUDIX domain-containing protein [Coriobacteriia bacterium]|nr:NUDIX domain-containing protein [Coriobacteriia bacterium]